MAISIFAPPTTCALTFPTVSEMAWAEAFSARPPTIMTPSFAVLVTVPSVTSSTTGAVSVRFFETVRSWPPLQLIFRLPPITMVSFPDTLFDRDSPTSML